MTPNDLAAEIYLTVLRERIDAKGIGKINPDAMEAAALKACELSDIFWKALGDYAKAKGYAPMPPAQPGQVQGVPTAQGPQPPPPVYVAPAPPPPVYVAPAPPPGPLPEPVANRGPHP